MLKLRHLASIQEVTFEQMKLIFKMTRWLIHPRPAIDPIGTLDLVIVALLQRPMVDLLRSYRRQINPIMRRCLKVFRVALCLRWRCNVAENKLPQKIGNNIHRFRGLILVAPNLDLYTDRDQICKDLLIAIGAHPIHHQILAQSELRWCSSMMVH